MKSGQITVFGILLAYKHKFNFFGSFVPFYCKRYESRSEEHTSELQSRSDLVCRLLLEKKKNTRPTHPRKTRFGTPTSRQRRVSRATGSRRQCPYSGFIRSTRPRYPATQRRRP